MPSLTAFERAGQSAGKSAFGVPNSIKKTMGDLNDIASGNFGGLIDRALDKLFGRFIPPSDYRLIGGVPMDEAREIYREMMTTRFSKSNLFHIAIEDIKPTVHSFAKVNLFLNSCSYQPFTITGEAVKIGSGSYDQIIGSERVEFNCVAKDDMDGSIKKWLGERASLIARPDGTFGLPVDYLMRVMLTHSFPVPDSPEAANCVTDKYIMRLGSVEYQKDRGSDQLEEITFTLVQFDTFSNIV